MVRMVLFLNWFSSLSTFFVWICCIEFLLLHGSFCYNIIIQWCDIVYFHAIYAWAICVGLRPTCILTIAFMQRLSVAHQTERSFSALPQKQLFSRICWRSPCIDLSTYFMLVTSTSMRGSLKLHNLLFSQFITV